MGLSTVNWDRVVALAEAKIGADLNDKSTARLGHLINASARYIYDESRYHPRFLVLEPRTATSGYIEPVEDSYHITGAGTAGANGLYVRNGSSIDGNPAYTKYDSDGTTAMYSMWSESGTGWYITSSPIDDNTGAIYLVPSTSTTPPAGWASVTSGDTPPTVQALSEIDEIITYWDGERWVGANPAQAYGYPDQNGFRLTTNLTGIIYVAHKKSLPDAYGDGTLGTSGDFPSEWLNYCAQSAAQQWMESNRREESFNPISVRSVEKLEGQVLIKANRQGAFDTIGNIWTTRYSMDTSVTGYSASGSGSSTGGSSGAPTGSYYIRP